MKKDKKESYFWKRNFNIAQFENIPTEVNRFNFRDTEVDDEWLFFITSRIKIIHQLDLDNTYVTNEGVNYLTKLEYIKELRLKGCNITNECLNDLNKLTGLELLHLGGTMVDLNRLNEISSLTNLKMLLLTSKEEKDVIHKKATVLKQLFPSSVIIINGQSYE